MVFKFRDNAQATHYIDVTSVVTIGWDELGQKMAEAYDGGENIISYSTPVIDDNPNAYTSYYVVYPKFGPRYIIKVKDQGAAWLMNDEGKTIENISYKNQVLQTKELAY